MVPPPSSQSHSLRVLKKGKSVSSRSPHQSYIPHILQWWTVPAVTAEEHFNNSITRAQISDKPFLLPSHIIFWTKLYSYIQADFFVNVLLEHTIFTMFIISLVLALNTTWKDEIKEKGEHLIFYICNNLNTDFFLYLI